MQILRKPERTIKNFFTLPEKVVGVSNFKRYPIILGALGGISSATAAFMQVSVDDDLKNGEKPSFLKKALAYASQPLFALLSLNSMVTGFNLASIPRMTAYAVMFLLSLFGAKNYIDFIEKREELLDSKQNQELKKEVSHLNSVNTFLSIVAFPLIMGLTFVANLTQRTPVKKYQFESLKEIGTKELLGEFKDKVGTQLSKEVNGFWYHTKELLSPNSWKQIITNFKGGNPEYNQKMSNELKNNNSWNRFLYKFGDPQFTCNLVLINMFARMLSGILSLIPILKYGTDYYNIGTVYEDSQLALVAQADQSRRNVSDIANALRNFGLLLMSACSISSGVSDRFKEGNGILAQKAELIGGIGYGLTTVMDWTKNYGPGYSTKILSSSLCQASVSLGAAKKEVERFRKG